MISLVKNIKYLVICVFMSALTLSCVQKETKSNMLSVTIEPQRYFLEKIVGDHFKVTSLVPSGANPESFDPTPSQMMALDKSRVYFKIGFLGIENTLVDKIKQQSELKIVDCSKGIRIIEEEHHHHDEGQQNHGHDGGDPHYWSSINSSKVILKNMYEEISLLDADNKEFYTSNYQHELSKINDTDSIIRSLLDQSKSKAFIIYHPALSYFAEEFSLEQLTIEQEGKSPSPAHLKQLIDEAKEKNVKAVFVQAEYDSKNASVIASQIGADTYSINLLSYDWHDEMLKIAKAIARE